MMHLTRRIVVLGACIAGILSLPSLQASTGSHTANLVRMMASAPGRVSYWGRKIVSLGAGPGAAKSTVVEYHQPPDKWRFEYLAPSSAKGRIVVVTGTKRLQYEPAKKLVIETKASQFAPQPNNPNLILRNYRVVERPKQVVAGNSCIVIELWPKQKGKAMRKFWLDARTGIILKRERHQPGKNTDSLSGFEEFHANVRIPNSKFEVPHGPGQHVVRRKSQKTSATDRDLLRELGSNAYRSKALPAGYIRENTAIAKGAASVTAQAVYTDGLTDVSLFQTRAHKGSRLKPVGPADGHDAKVRGRSAEVRTHGTISSVTWQEADVRYTLVSEVAPSLLLYIANEMH